MACKGPEAELRTVGRSVISPTPPVHLGFGDAKVFLSISSSLCILLSLPCRLIFITSPEWRRWCHFLGRIMLAYRFVVERSHIILARASPHFFPSMRDFVFFYIFFSHPVQEINREFGCVAAGMNLVTSVSA